MTTVSGKQRELRQRDDLFLRLAQAMLLSDGYHGLTMSRIAEAARFSKGTVYARFACKEELVAELGFRCTQKRLEMIERCVQFPGRPRERMVALGEATEHFFRLYPDELRVIHIIDAEAVLEKVSEEQRARMKSADLRVFEIMSSIIVDAVDCGDLVLPARSSPAELCFALWGLVDGGASAVLGGLPLSHLGISDSYGAIARGCHLLMDGSGWHPLSSEWQYSTVARQIREAVLSDEARQVSSRLARQAQDVSAS
ncbi:MAG: TetR/AcrR family transcriptional regulator [Candidatus Hydrogenedentes bacterium]|nr:TetR/AcrR family transcriptional regulator [Candidatus Hydrogenedentota bacterium]